MRVFYPNTRIIIRAVVIVTKTISLAELTIMTSLMVATTWILIRVFENIKEAQVSLVNISLSSKEFLPL